MHPNLSKDLCTKYFDSYNDCKKQKRAELDEYLKDHPRSLF